MNATSITFIHYIHYMFNVGCYSYQTAFKIGSFLFSEINSSYLFDFLLLFKLKLFTEIQTVWYFFIYQTLRMMLEKKYRE